MSTYQFIKKTVDVQIKLIFPIEFNNSFDKNGVIKGLF
jgi:hypothetical protein